MTPLPTNVCITASSSSSVSGVARSYWASMSVLRNRPTYSP
ncbi:Uncharacterised protein [Mycobacteroides abscessus]|nr:Uncharacterised protein [Mycobacteroides abscessus]